MSGKKRADITFAGFLIKFERRGSNMSLHLGFIENRYLWVTRIFSAPLPHTISKKFIFVQFETQFESIYNQIFTDHGYSKFMASMSTICRTVFGPER